MTTPLQISVSSVRMCELIKIAFLRSASSMSSSRNSTRPRVETGGGLVQNQNVRVINKRPAERDTLFHALGKRLEVFLTDARDVRKFFDRLDRLGSLFSLQAIGAGKKIQIFVDGNITVSRQGVGNIADNPARQFRFFANGNAVQQNVARGGFLNGRNNPHRRRLARAIRSDEPKDVAGVKGKRDIVHGHRLAKFLAQIL